MNMHDIINYSDQQVMFPIIREVGLLLLKVIYGRITPDDIDMAKNLVYNADITADWLEILAEGNPDYLDDVIEQVHYDLCLSEETCLQIPSLIDLAIEEEPAECNIVHINLEDTKLDADERHYLATEFGIEFDEGIQYNGCYRSPTF